jgi:hypothetical protein
LYVNNTNFNKLPIGILSQTKIGPTGCYNIPNNSGFPSPISSHLLASTTFNVMGVTGPRKIRTHININIEDITSNNNNNLYLSLYDGSTLVNNYTHAYINGNLCTSLNFYNYSTIPVDTTNKTYHLYACSSTTTSTISSNTGTYATVEAPASYITIEDLGIS